MLYFEDFPEGATRRFGAKTVTADEIVAFARAFDPQPMHLSEAGGAASLLGGLAASGWHTAAMLMRMIVDAYMGDTASLGSPGLDELRWMKPVRPGDVLTASYRVTEARRSQSKPGIGIARFLYEVRNQHDDVVMTWNCIHMLGCRPPSGGVAA